MPNNKKSKRDKGKKPKQTMTWREFRADPRFAQDIQEQALVTHHSNDTQEAAEAPVAVLQSHLYDDDDDAQTPSQASSQMQSISSQSSLQMQSIYRLMPQVSDNKMKINIKMSAENADHILQIRQMITRLFPNPKSQARGVFNIEPMGRCWGEVGNYREHQFSIYFCYGEGGISENELYLCNHKLLNSLIVPEAAFDKEGPIITLRNLEHRTYIKTIRQEIYVSLVELETSLTAFLDHIATVAENKTGRPINEEPEQLQGELRPAKVSGFGLFPASLSNGASEPATSPSQSVPTPYPSKSHLSTCCNVT